MGTFLIGNAWKLESLGVETSFETGSARVSAEISRMYRPVRKSARDARFAESPGPKFGNARRISRCDRQNYPHIWKLIVVDLVRLIERSFFFFFFFFTSKINKFKV